MLWELVAIWAIVIVASTWFVRDEMRRRAAEANRPVPREAIPYTATVPTSRDFASAQQTLHPAARNFVVELSRS